MHTPQINQFSLLWFSFSREADITRKIILAVFMATLTGLMAQIRIPLPFTPVPVTGQTFAVLLSGILLGKNWGGISQIIYAVLGVAGLPWFSGAMGGQGVILGPTGGYVVGFVLCAFFLGFVVDRFPRFRSFLPMLCLMLAANFVLIFVPGLVQLYLWLKIAQGQTPALLTVLNLGFFPFMAGAVIKSALAALIASRILPKPNP